jgi:hypothetical protein
MGMEREAATAVVGQAFPESERMRSASSIRRCLAEFFHDDGRTSFSNTAIKFTMETWLQQNQHKVITEKDAGDPDNESKKCFIAQHAADHLNKLLDAHPRFKSDKMHAASTPVQLGVMRTWLKVKDCVQQGMEAE